VTVAYPNTVSGGTGDDAAVRRAQGLRTGYVVGSARAMLGAAASVESRSFPHGCRAWFRRRNRCSRLAEAGRTEGGWSAASSTHTALLDSGRIPWCTRYTSTY